MREIVRPALFDELTQGAIFNGMVNDGFFGYGMVITARCDIGWDKVDKINYLQVMKLEDWWNVHGKKLIYKKAASNIEKEVLKIFKRYHFHEDLLKYYPADLLVEKILAKSSEDAKSLEALLNVSEDNIFELPYAFVMAAKKSTLSDVLKNRISGYYFLESIDPHGDDHGYVIDLRNPMTLPMELIKDIKSGVESDGVFASYGVGQVMKVPDGETVMLFSCILSPYIEHIMQSFSSLFSRIGLEDLGKEYVDNKIKGFL